MNAVILAESKLGIFTAKTATCVIRYRTGEVAAVIDSTKAGTTVQRHIGVGGDIPVVSSVRETLGSSPDTLIIGIAPPGGGLVGALLPLVLLFLVFYFLLIRPQQNQAKKHKQFLEGLNKGDEVVTSGGIHGRVTGITETVITLEIADKVRIKVQRGNISGMKPKPAEKTG